jgi:putative transcriptional regulator
VAPYQIGVQESNRMIPEITPCDLLIAPPNIPDPRFRDSVMMIINHDLSGTVALCLNRPTEITTDDLDELEDIPQISHPIYWGGPVAPDSVWMLHTDEWASRNTMAVAGGCYLTSDRDMLLRIRQGDCPREFRLFTGFASWAPGQLAAELEGRPPWKQQHSWLIAPPADLEDLLECPVEDLWTWATTVSANSAVDRWL